MGGFKSKIQKIRLYTNQFEIYNKKFAKIRKFKKLPDQKIKHKFINCKIAIIGICFENEISKSKNLIRQYFRIDLFE